MSPSPWSTLGIDRTDDVTAIRKAYARRLKATDVDDDPDAFIALRGALEYALDEARWGFADDGGDDAPPDLAVAVAGEDDMAWPDDLAAGMDLQLPPPEAVPSSAPVAPYERLSGLLFDQHDPHPDRDALEAAARDILADPGLANVDRAASAEQWFAATLYDSIPRSDPVIPLVVAHFEWERGAGRWDQPFLIEELVSRHRAILLLDHIADPRHAMNKAYLDLTSAEPGLGLDRFVIGRSVRRLLTLIRENCPSAEDDLNPHRVALWDERHDATVTHGLGRAALGFWLIFLLIRLAIGAGLL